MKAVVCNVVVGEQAVTLDQVVAIAEGVKQLSLSKNAAFLRKIDAAVEFLDRTLAEDGTIYGVTTGYGDSCTVAVPKHLVEELPLHLVRYHGCGLGAELSESESIAVLVVRLVSLALGYSGVRYDILHRLADCIGARIAPILPSEGSVGASGDLTPLSYVAALLCGEREVIYKEQRREASHVLDELGWMPLTLRPKEALAVMNGTSVMTALACFAHVRAEYLARVAARITSLNVLATAGNVFHYDETLFNIKPHPGQMKAAAWIRSDFTEHETLSNPKRLQDRYSLRCAPHVIGVLLDALPLFKSLIETEINSANDNPLIAAEQGRVLHGGHFYGGHIAFVMDSLKTLVANIADLLDRQLALVVDPKFNHGLPANLCGVLGERSAINHGFKAVQIAVSAWTAEALKLTMPASVFSRSTECHNQDKVSMGTIAARDCLRVLTLVEQVAAATLFAACQAFELRARQDPSIVAHAAKSLPETLTHVFSIAPFVEEDRPLAADLHRLVAVIRARSWCMYEVGA
jgi:histidine ammonia-lyase